MLATKYNAESNLQSKVKIVESPPLCPPPIPTPEGPDNVKVQDLNICFSIARHQDIHDSKFN